MRSIHLWCAYAVLLGIIQTSFCATLRCYKGSQADYDEASLREAENLLDSKCYNNLYRNIFYVFGFVESPDSSSTRSVLKALLRLKKINIFLLNWEKEASADQSLGPISKGLTYDKPALIGVEKVGKAFGRALVRMAEIDFDLNNTLLVGHSLGAQVLGVTGRTVKKYGRIVDRILALDAAGPLFETPPIKPSVGEDCARFVDCIHTNPGGYGILHAYCTVDIYVNFRDKSDQIPEEHIQPGCRDGQPSLNIQSTLVLDQCSHYRSWKLFIASTKCSKKLIASEAENYDEWAAGNGNNSDITNIGINTNRNACGKYFMTTNASPPYGKGEDGLHP